VSLDQKRARWFGVLYLITFLTSIPALALYEPALQHPVAWVANGTHDKQILLGAFLELLLIISNIGTAVVILPIVRRYNEDLGVGYVTARLAPHSRLRHAMIYGWIGFGLILSLAGPWNADAGSAVDFRLDHAAMCLWGITATSALLTRGFRDLRWSLAFGALTGLTVMERFRRAGNADQSRHDAAPRPPLKKPPGASSPQPFLSRTG
jgi:hypothetical protein